MCMRFVYNGDNAVVGFNFDIDLSVWTHMVIAEKDRFFIGIKMPDNQYHSFHGIHRNGNVGTLLYVNGNKNGEYSGGEGYIIILAFCSMIVFSFSLTRINKFLFLASLIISVLS